MALEDWVLIVCITMMGTVPLAAAVFALVYGVVTTRGKAPGHRSMNLSQTE